LRISAHLLSRRRSADLLGRKFIYQTNGEYSGDKKMATQVPSQSTSTSSQTQAQTPQTPIYENCLLVTRHQLLSQQETDVNTICRKITRVDTLPTDVNQLKKVVDFYDAVVGVIPLPFQVQLLQMKKNVILFYMESLGTTKTKAEAEELLKKSGLDGVILPPAKEGEPYRVTVYKGLILVKNIIVEDEFVIKHG